MDGSSLLRSEAELEINQSRKEKAERTKNIGDPITLLGKALDIRIQGNYAWIAENTTVARVLNLETGNTIAVLREHTAPVASLAFYIDNKQNSDHQILFTGSWDKTIRTWDCAMKKQMFSTSAHSDFVKALLVIPEMRLLVSAGSDKIVRLWDLTYVRSASALSFMGSITDHTRPVEALAADTPSSEGACTLFTADTMGIIRVWTVQRDPAEARCQIIPRTQLDYHRTGVTDIIYGAGQLWSSSLDESVQCRPYPPLPGPAAQQSILNITHPHGVRCMLPLSLTALGEPYLITGSGDCIRTYDVSDPKNPELLSTIDAHWHDVTALRLWIRKAKEKAAKAATDGSDAVREETHAVRHTVEPWIVSASLDGTIRRWRLADLLNPPPPPPKIESAPPAPSSGLTEEEERELAELMED